MAWLEIQVIVDFLEDLREEETLPDLDALCKRILRLRYVTEVCVDHQCWARLSLETHNWETAQGRAAVVLGKIHRAIKQTRRG